jgi:hypothetical protein
MWQKHKVQLANFDKATLRVYLVSLGPLLGCRHIEMSRAESARCNSLLMWSCEEWRMGSVFTFDTTSLLYWRRRLETCVQDPISKRRAIHFKLMVVSERRALASDSKNLFRSTSSRKISSRRSPRLIR